MPSAFESVQDLVLGAPPAPEPRRHPRRNRAPWANSVSGPGKPLAGRQPPAAAAAGLYYTFRRWRSIRYALGRLVAGADPSSADRGPGKSIAAPAGGSRTWLKPPSWFFTHGYGFTVSPCSTRRPDRLGRRFFVKDLGPQRACAGKKLRPLESVMPAPSEPSLFWARPRLYYAPKSAPYVIRSNHCGGVRLPRRGAAISGTHSDGHWAFLARQCWHGYQGRRCT